MCIMGNMKGMPINEIENILKEYFQRQPEIEVAYIFGSVAQGRTSALSDIDIAIIIDRQQIKEETYRYGYKSEILTHLMKLLKRNDVDLVILNDSKTLLKHRVLYFGRLIYSKNERKRIAFQTSTIDQYNDYKQLIKPHFVTGEGS